MNNIVFSTRNIDDFISDLANEVVRKLELYHNKPRLSIEPPEKWFDINELCEYHPDKPKKATVYGLVHRGEIPCHKGGKKLRFLRSEIDLWLKSGRKKTRIEIGIEADQYLTKKANHE